MKTNFTLHGKLRGLLLALLLIYAAGTNAQTTHEVQVTNNVFTPSELTIAVGDIVEWKNIEGTHNVNGNTSTYPDNPESFGNEVGSGWTYSFTFNTAGTYNYQCDPHVGSGMIGKVEVVSDNDDNKNMLTIQFTGMNPHVGQMLYLSVVDKSSGMEVARTMVSVNAEFQVQVSGLETDHSYYVNFFADHNGNGMYDAPPTDHAWQMEVDNVSDDVNLNFAHNINFIDIMWQNKLTVQFSGMNPHDGQMLSLAVVDKSSGMEIARTMVEASPEFEVQVLGIEIDHSYYVNFFADHNGNGMYDAPPTDHAWQMELDNVMGDTTLMFAHNTDFTDIMWQNKLTVQFSGMNPHVGQSFYLWVIDQSDGTEVYTTELTVATEFEVVAYGIETGKSYAIDFYSDHNGSGSYDAPPTDHAWRMELNNVVGDTVLNFSHNINFTDIFNITSVSTTELMPFTMYPNPATNKVTLEYDGFNKNASIRILDLAGKAHAVRSTNSGNKIELDLSNIPQGLYLIQLQDGDLLQTQKLLKR
ncbi:plastocyanin/azurin family copper-binding protein [Draconibacterium halophilum]|uniref:T9SS type A sorting domain-containing protein n=1 Tax=Draconibacterium halophilum TaxID=2706887 RepID=A0A6C0R818_9BACT|nr:plastocyanin/azurin family copper-binding protein [Draconibacterium halophilum]QIA06488.1 T9SS type A sorting domain-containing protein [Draconibacterium halophilum]